MLKKPEPTIDTKAAEAIECAYLALSYDVSLLESDGASYRVLGHLVKAFGGMPQQGLPSFDKYDDGGGQTVIAKAKDGDRAAHDTLCEIASTMLVRSEQWPLSLAQYFLDVSTDGPPKWTRGQRAHVHVYRDTLIGLAVKKVCGEFDLRRTRSRSAKAGREVMSGCAVVHAAMRRLHKEGAITSVPTERVIEKISDALTENL